MATYSIEQKQTGMQKKKDFASLMVEIGAQLFVDGQWVATQYQTEIGEDIFYQGKEKRSLDLTS